MENNISRKSFLKKLTGYGSAFAMTMIACQLPQSETPVSSSSSDSKVLSFEINFNKSMNISSVENSLSISPDISSNISGSPVWSNSNQTVAYSFSNAVSGQAYSVTVAGSTTDSSGNQLDGNKDGIAGDQYSFTISPEQTGTII